MRTFLVWLLLAFTPFIGVRLVCIERPAAAPAASGGETSAHCDDFCPRPPAGGTSDVDCVFLADGALLMVVAGLAVLPVPPSVRIESVSLSVSPEQHDLYLAPFLAHHSPPPKA